MLGMSRWKWALVIAVALLLAIEPLAHAHPIGSDSQCAICAAGNPCLTELPAAPVAPRVVVWTLTRSQIVLPSFSEATDIPSRAPPSV